MARQNRAARDGGDRTNLYDEITAKIINELEQGRLPFDMRIERDLHFTGDFPISVWADMARRAGGIRQAERILYSGARAASTPTRKPTDTQSRKY